MLQDLRYSIRTLAKHPGFVITVAVVLALGIGINVALFSIVNAVLFRPLPVQAPDALVYLYEIHPKQPDRPQVSGYPFYEFLRRHNEVFSDLTGHWVRSKGCRRPASPRGRVDGRGRHRVADFRGEYRGIAARARRQPDRRDCDPPGRRRRGWRIARQLLVESELLASLGGALGLAVATWLLDLFRAYTPNRFELDVPMDARVIAFAAVVCLGVGVVIGVVPAVRATRVQLTSSLPARRAARVDPMIALRQL